MNWISVKDKLPELQFEDNFSKSSQFYLVWDVSGDWGIASYVFSNESKEYYWESDYDCMKYNCEITHWAENIEGPNEVE